ncbi:unnamed protein product, partial [Pleuronectes platessa]
RSIRFIAPSQVIPTCDMSDRPVTFLTYLIPCIAPHHWDSATAPLGLGAVRGAELDKQRNLRQQMLL